jgi:uncharacterized FAD-dependent dehydrogenase
VDATGREDARPQRWIRVLALGLALDEPESLLRDRAADALGVAREEVRKLRVARRALDGRARGAPRFVVHVDVALDPGTRTDGLDRALGAGRARELPPPTRFELFDFERGWQGRVAVVVGAGPAGLFAAYVLALHGVRVELLDRGPDLRARGRAVARFFRSREIDPERNLLYGEGGAGTYSDGKLYTRTQHALEEPILEALVACGAPEEIAYDARAHIGTDRLHRVLPRLRAQLEAAGVRFHFGTRLESLVVAGDATQRIRAVRTSTGELGADAVILAPGHSARDTLRALAAQGVVAQAKPFQLGVRVEHPQELVDRGRYRDPALAARLGASYYALVEKGAAGRAGVHSFCMCPGGQIVAAVSEPGLLCTNGMSNSRHSSPYANAGLVVTVDPRGGAFAGVELQEMLERRFYDAGGGGFRAPAQRLADFQAGVDSRALRPTSYKLGIAPARIDALLPEWIRDALRGALGRFERDIPGFVAEGQLVGIESRSSGAVRLPRDPETRLAEGFANLYPAGEGAGYAGGIMSAAIDGARSAQALLRQRPL